MFSVLVVLRYTLHDQWMFIHRWIALNMKNSGHYTIFVIYGTVCHSFVMALRKSDAL